MKQEKKVDFIIGLIGLVLYVVGFFLKLFVLTRLWALILVPMGAPEITKWQAYGVILVASLAVSDVALTKQDRDDSNSQKLLRMGVGGIVIPLISWGLASILF